MFSTLGCALYHVPYTKLPPCILTEKAPSKNVFILNFHLLIVQVYYKTSSEVKIYDFVQVFSLYINRLLLSWSNKSSGYINLFLKVSENINNIQKRSDRINYK